MRNSQPPQGWYTFGTHVDIPVSLEFSEEKDEAGMPLWERPTPKKFASVGRRIHILPGLVDGLNYPAGKPVVTFCGTILVYKGKPEEDGIPYCRECWLTDIEINKAFALQYSTRAQEMESEYYG